MNTLLSFVSTLLYTLVETAPYVLIGYLVAALIREFLPQEFLVRWLGPQGLAPLLKSIGVGALLPICSCGVVPLSVGLVRCGAARGTVLSFMASAPAISPVSLLLGYSLLGGRFMVTYVGVVLVGAFVMGWIGNRVLASGHQGPGAPTSRRKGFQSRETDLVAADRKRSFPRRLARAGHWAFFDLGAEISLDLLFGLTLATIVSVLVPSSWIATWLGGTGLVSLLFVIALSLPVYTCSTPSLPVVQKLVLLGASPGVAVAYLIAGPATNLGELAVIRRSMGLRTMLYYVVGMVLLALSGGLLANFLWRDDSGLGMIGLSAKHLGSQLAGVSDFTTVYKLLQDGGWWAWLSSVLVIAILIVGSFKKIRLLFVDPCQHCLFWNDVSKTVACPGRCWLKSAQLEIKRFLPWR
ncbi:MAG TPA: permease [Fibrobacteraceae bacterium]|nr:permease [Fibrobacteraceae bacterium]